MKFKSVPKTKREIIEKVKPLLPKGWTLNHISDDKRWFFINIPINQYFVNDPRDKKLEERKIAKIEHATGYMNNGGGFLIGAKRYTLDFYFG